MGMAAGQARLLSITSRMSDNELRAQVINNNKMRLATQSSQVSEAYVTALNEAQMMFTNYDAENKTSYQKLTYNALTAYNPYNNQYIVTNASGNVLLSESDAVKYKNANGDLEKFLESYGLKRDTTYFEQLATHYEKGKGLAYKTGLINETTGEEILDYINIPGADENTEASAFEKYIKALYEGISEDDDWNSELHPGYANAVSSNEYYEYTKNLSDFTTKQDAYLECVAQLMTDKLKELKSGTDSSIDSNYRGKTLTELKSLLKETAETATADDPNDKTANKNVLNALLSIVTTAAVYATSNGQSYFNDLKTLINTNKEDNITYILDKEDASFNKENSIEYKDSSGSKQTLNNALVYQEKDQEYDEASKQYKEVLGDKYIFYKDGSNNYKLIITDKDGNVLTNPKLTTSTTSTTSTTTNPSISDGNVVFELESSETEEGTTTTTKFKLSFPTSYFSGLPANDSWQIKQSTENSVNNMKQVAESVIESLQSAIYSVWNPSHPDFVPTDSNKFGYNEYKAYEKAAKELSKILFGVEIAEDYYANLEDIEWVKSIFDKSNTVAITTPTGTTNYTPDEAKKTAFQKIYDVYLLDCVMNTYGEPKYAWIDKNNKKENADAKAQWYENLFNRIQSGGYKVLQDGLASSNEWMQFAFESGIVNMEQVDANKNWQPLIYSNCADITEQTNDAAVTKAEAEYKTAMNKIENKDKRYDLELKNIDTEHNSLQTEYESIKSAIDKNIERTFKLYS